MRRSRASVGGTLLAARLALSTGVAGSAAGGSHHARREQGAGFCVLKRCRSCALTLRQEGRIGRAIVVDLDVHQGDGTPIACPGSRTCSPLDPCERNYPSQEDTGATSDIGLPDRMGDGEYLAVLEARLPPLLDALSRISSSTMPGSIRTGTTGSAAST